MNDCYLKVCHAWISRITCLYNLLTFIVWVTNSTGQYAMLGDITNLEINEFPRVMNKLYKGVDKFVIQINDLPSNFKPNWDWNFEVTNYLNFKYNDFLKLNPSPSISLYILIRNQFVQCCHCCGKNFKK